MGKHRWPTVGDTSAPDIIPPPGAQPPAARKDPAPDATRVPQRQDVVVQPGLPDRPGVQWRVVRSAALVFLGVALAIGGALFLVRSSEPSAAAMTVQLDDKASGGSVAGSVPEAADQGAVSGVDSPGEGADSIGLHVPVPSIEAGPVSGEVARTEIVVYVTGAVASPGVVTVIAGTRLFEVIDRAGGSLPEADLEGINLAATPSDGEHVHLLAVGEEPRPGVPVVGEPGPQGGQGSGQLTLPADGAGNAGGTPSAATIIDINTATLAEIELLPRVGPVLGQRIIDWRQEHGKFGLASDIDAVPGIGPAMLEGILPLITVQ